MGQAEHLQHLRWKWAENTLVFARHPQGTLMQQQRGEPSVCLTKHGCSSTRRARGSPAPRFPAARLLGPHLMLPHNPALVDTRSPPGSGEPFQCPGCRRQAAPQALPPVLHGWGLGLGSAAKGRQRAEPRGQRQVRFCTWGSACPAPLPSACLRMHAGPCQVLCREAEWANPAGTPLSLSAYRSQARNFQVSFPIHYSARGEKQTWLSGREAEQHYEQAGQLRS